VNEAFGVRTAFLGAFERYALSWCPILNIFHFHMCRLKIGRDVVIIIDLEFLIEAAIHQWLRNRKSCRILVRSDISKNSIINEDDTALYVLRNLCCNFGGLAEG